MAQRLSSFAAGHFRGFHRPPSTDSAVAHRDIGAVVGLVDGLRIEREPDTRRQPWPNEPVAMSTKERRGVGPLQDREPSVRNFSNSGIWETIRLPPRPHRETGGVPLEEQTGRYSGNFGSWVVPA